MYTRNATRYSVLGTLLFLCFACGSHHESAPKKTQIIHSLPRRTTKLTIKERAQLDSLEVGYMLSGYCHAYSSPGNAEPPNGEGRSENLPYKVDQSFPKAGIYLVINQGEYVAAHINLPVKEALGHKLYLVNTSDSLLRLEASDSRLCISAEAKNAKGIWAPITYFASSDCGNSYHTVALDKNEFWQFEIPVFKGVFKTKLRYVLEIDKKRKIISNEINANVSPTQFRHEGELSHALTTTL